MALRIKPSVKGDEIHKIKIMETLKTPILNLYKTYPIYYSHGIIETYFEKGFAEEIVTKLNEDGFIDIKPNTFPRAYRLTPKGIDLAISMINLKYNEQVLNYANKTNRLTDTIKFLTIILAIFNFASLFIIWLQYMY